MYEAIVNYGFNSLTFSDFRITIHSLNSVATLRNLFVLEINITKKRYQEHSRGELAKTVKADKTNDLNRFIGENEILVKIIPK